MYSVSPFKHIYIVKYVRQFDPRAWANCEQHFDCTVIAKTALHQQPAYNTVLGYRSCLANTVLVSREADFIENLYETFIKQAFFGLSDI